MTRHILYNPDNLNKSDITEEVTRVKLILINSKNEILICYSNKTYFFVGGHVEEGETLVEAINRECLEETGIELNIKEIEPSVIAENYTKDWPEEHKNRNSKIYYYVIYTDEEINLNKISRTKNEENNHFTLKYVKIDDIENVMLDNSNEYERTRGITNENLNVLKILNIVK